MTDELTRRPVELRPAAGPRRPGRGPKPQSAAAEQAERDAERAAQAADPAAWSVEVCSDDAVWAPGSASAQEWDLLWARCPGSTVFQHSAWLQSWWAAYGEPGRLRVVLVRQAGVLMAAAPLKLCRRGLLSVLSLVGNGISDFGGILVAADPAAQECGPPAGESGARAEALARLRTALAGLGRPIDLRELPPGSDARLLAEDWPYPVRVWTDSACLFLPARSFEETVRALPRRTASRVRGKSRRIDELGVLCLTTPAAEAKTVITQLLRLHEEQWKDRGISAEHMTERFRGHLSACVPALIEAGYADLVRYEYEGELLGCELMLHSRSTAGSYLSGLSPRLRQKVDLATLMLRNGMGLSVEREAAEYSMLRGLEPYKLRWSPRLVHNERLLLGGKGSATTTVYAQSIAGRKRMVKLAKKALRREDRTAQEMRARLGDTDWMDTE
ncbi:MAG TPA: GNAT family N-acetyltransferase [Actinocrinis sp.]|nr:GNAT family N-acetyltransferase [Actinocrinis sp.]